MYCCWVVGFWKWRLRDTPGFICMVSSKALLVRRRTRKDHLFFMYSLISQETRPSISPCIVKIPS